MPELPEVETARRGISPHILGRRVDGIIVRQRHLRWPIPVRLEKELPGQTIDAVLRRGKYLILRTASGDVLLHLGMSGSLHIVTGETPAGAHDHVDFLLENHHRLRLRDPRRFGTLLWAKRAEQHRLLRNLGPEPLGDDFNGRYLFECSRNRQVAVKNLIMNSRIVVGVGNIYASEALYAAGIHPRRAAGRISAVRYEELATRIKRVLQAAIRAGGTTLRDFTRGDGEPGYFAVELKVYDRTGKPCERCGTPIARFVLGQRSTYYCPRCQR